MGIYSQKLFISPLPPPLDGTVKGSSCYSRRKLKTGKKMQQCRRNQHCGRWQLRELWTKRLTDMIRQVTVTEGTV